MQRRINNKPLTLTWSTGKIQPVSCPAPVTSRSLCALTALFLPLSLDPFISLGNELSCRAAVVCLLAVYSLLGQGRGRVRGRSKLISLKTWLLVACSTYNSHKPWTVTLPWSQLNEAGLEELRSHRKTPGFPLASGLVPVYLRQSALLASCHIPRQPNLAAHLHRERTREENPRAIWLFS